jgi:hypothetical protein
MSTTRKRWFVRLVPALCLVPVWLLAQDGTPVYTDVEAAERDLGFRIQGEYLGEASRTGDTPDTTTPLGLQVVSLGGTRFQVVVHQGGLPGAGSDGRNASVLRARLVDDELRIPAGPVDRIAIAGDGVTGYRGDTAIWTARRVERTSPTLGAPAPAGAVVLFNGRGAEAFEGGQMTPDGLLMPGTRTVRSFGNFSLHLEFRLPYKPTVFPGDQDRGNSGVYIFDRYEVQILDSFGLHYAMPDGWEERFRDEWLRNPPSNRTQWAAALYLTRPPDVAMSLPPLVWQTYDIDFTAPRFVGEKKISNARITLRHNGVIVHEDVELTGGTGAGSRRPEIASGPIVLQDHANPVRFRNIWMVDRR